MSLDGSNNHRVNTRWSVALGPFRPRATYNFLDGIGAVDPSLPNPRNISNRVFGVGPFRLNEFKISALAAAWGTYHSALGPVDLQRGEDELISCPPILQVNSSRTTSFGR